MVGALTVLFALIDYIIYDLNAYVSSQRRNIFKISENLLRKIPNS